MRTIIEPFRIKSVEPIRATTREERQQLIEAAGYNLFLVPSDAILIDPLAPFLRHFTARLRPVAKGAL